MRVLLCVPAFEPAHDYGGPITKLALLIPALQALSVDVEVLTADFGFERTRVAPGRRTVDGVPVTYLRRVVSRRWVSVAFGAKGVLERARFDVVHCFGLRDGVVVSAARAASGATVPVVLEPMGMAVPRIRTVALKRVFDFAYARLGPRPAATIATSSLEATELAALGFPNIVIRPNPIELPTGLSCRPAPSYDLCYVGRLHEKKRLSDIVTALIRDPTLSAVIAGPDEDGTAEMLRRQAARAGISGRLQVLGWVTSDERRTILESSRCFVLASASENFGNSAAEAIAHGTPAVVTDQCGVAALVAETGMGEVVPVDTAAVVEAIDRVLQSQYPPSRPEALGRFAPGAVASTQLEIYESVSTSALC